MRLTINHGAINLLNGLTLEDNAEQQLYRIWHRIAPTKPHRWVKALYKRYSKNEREWFIRNMTGKYFAQRVVGIWNGNNWIRYNNYLKYIWTWTGIVQREGPQMGKWDQLKWGTLVNMDKLARGPVFVLYRYIHLIYHVDFSFLQGPCLIEITIWVKSPNENNFWPMLCLEQHMQETC